MLRGWKETLQVANENNVTHVNVKFPQTASNESFATGTGLSDHPSQKSSKHFSDSSMGWTCDLFRNISYERMSRIVALCLLLRVTTEFSATLSGSSVCVKPLALHSLLNLSISSNCCTCLVGSCTDGNLNAQQWNEWVSQAFSRFWTKQMVRLIIWTCHGNEGTSGVCRRQSLLKS